MEELNNTTGAAPTATPESTAPAVPITPPEEKVSGCTGDCKRCHPLQQSYCAAQIGYNVQNMLDKMNASIRELKEDIASLKNTETPAIIEAPVPAEQPKKPKKPVK